MVTKSNGNSLQCLNIYGISLDIGYIPGTMSPSLYLLSHSSSSSVSLQSLVGVFSSCRVILCVYKYACITVCKASLYNNRFPYIFLKGLWSYLSLPELYFLPYPLLLHCELTSPDSFFLLTLNRSAFCLPSLESSPLWSISNFMTSIDIPNERHIPEDTKIISTDICLSGPVLLWVFPEVKHIITSYEPSSNNGCPGRKYQLVEQWQIHYGSS